jgi:hypothetical protein
MLKIKLIGGIPSHPQVFKSGIIEEGEKPFIPFHYRHVLLDFIYANGQTAT